MSELSPSNSQVDQHEAETRITLDEKSIVKPYLDDPSPAQDQLSHTEAKLASLRAELQALQRKVSLWMTLKKEQSNGDYGEEERQMRVDMMDMLEDSISSSQQQAQQCEKAIEAQIALVSSMQLHAAPQAGQANTIIRKIQPHAISTAVHDILRGFQQLTSFNKRQTRKEQDKLIDEAGRFRIWASNLAAHRTGRRSLDYRLRDSAELANNVLRFLEGLQKELQSSETLMYDNNKDSEESISDSADDRGSVMSGDSELFADWDTNTDLSPFEERLATIADITLCLLRISSTLRNPARMNQIQCADLIMTKHFEPKDIAHVREKFPKADTSLASRLGKAISSHRQCFKYRELHHSNLAEGIDDDHPEQPERPSTVATSLHKQDENDFMVQMRNESEAESASVATSYAGELSSAQHNLRPPSLPEAGLNGVPFECPLCFHIVTASDERSWRQHLYEDFPPYICTDLTCTTVTRQFSRRREWQQHMEYHSYHWVCPRGCSASFNTFAALKSHLVDAHPDLSNEVYMTGLEISCAMSNGAMETSLQCHLCQQVKPSKAAWYRHMAHHLEQLSLFAIPPHLLREADDDEDEFAKSDDESLQFSEPGEGIATPDSDDDSHQLVAELDSVRLDTETGKEAEEEEEEEEEKEREEGATPLPADEQHSHQVLMYNPQYEENVAKHIWAFEEDINRLAAGRQC